MAGGCGLSVAHNAIYGASQKWVTHLGNPPYMDEKQGEKYQSRVAGHPHKCMQNICICQDGQAIIILCNSSGVNQNCSWLQLNARSNTSWLRRDTTRWELDSCLLGIKMICHALFLYYCHEKRLDYLKFELSTWQCKPGTAGLALHTYGALNLLPLWQTLPLLCVNPSLSLFSGLASHF